MSVRAREFREHIVRPVLLSLNLWSQAAENLLMGTWAIESAMGQYLKQVGGPALGVFQMEPATHDDIWDNFLAYKPDLTALVKTWGVFWRADEMVWNLGYATCLARVHYFRVPAALPAADDVHALAHYWKNYYNTEKGKGQVQEFIIRYEGVR